MRLKFLLLLFISCVLHCIAYCQSDRDSLLYELNNAIKNTKMYDARKAENIKRIKTSFEGFKKNDLISQYQFSRQLYEEYKIFNFDTAYVYAGKMHDIALLLGDPSKMIQAKINLLFVLVSAGMYKEAYEVVNDINIAAQADSIKANYFSLKARYYFDLADYVNDQFHKPGYN